MEYMAEQATKTEQRLIEENRKHYEAAARRQEERENRMRSEDEARRQRDKEESAQRHEEQMAELQAQLAAVALKASEDRRRDDERLAQQEQ